MATVKSYTPTHKAGSSFQLTALQRKSVQNSSTPVQNENVIVDNKDIVSPEMVYLINGKFTANGSYKAPTGKAYSTIEVKVPGSIANQTETPALSVQPGEVLKGTQLEITCATEGATIHYTTDGSIPTLESPVYEGPIELTDSITVMALAVKLGLATSDTVTGVYIVTLPQVAAPVFSPEAGEVLSGTQLTMTCETPDAEIHYTVDGTTPNSDSPVYEGPLTLTVDTFVKAVAMLEGYRNSPLTAARYEIGIPTTANPAFSVQPGTVLYGTKVTISCATPNATIYYTTDGTVPSIESPVYDGSEIELTNRTVIQAVALADGHKLSEVVSGTYEISPDLLYYCGWVQAAEDVVPTEITAEEVENMFGAFDGVSESADSPDPTVYIAPQEVDVDYHEDIVGGRIVYAAPAKYGTCRYFTDGLGKHTITDSYTILSTTIRGRDYNVYISTHPIAPQTGQEFASRFTID